MLIGTPNTIVKVDHYKNIKEYFGFTPEGITYQQELSELVLNQDNQSDSDNLTALYRIVTNKQDYVVFDRLYELIFWIDMKDTSIKVKNIRNVCLEDCFNHKVTSVSYKSRDLTMNLEKWKLLWTDIGTNPEITECNYDGTDRKVLYSNNKQAIHLTVDYQGKRYFFVDLVNFGLYSIDYHGESEEFYFSSIELLGSLTGMGISNNDLYLANQNQIYAIKHIENKVELAQVLYKTHSFNKLQKTMPTSIDKLFYEIDCLVINRTRFDHVLFNYDHVHHNLINRCQTSECEHLCLPIGDTMHRCLAL